LMTTVKAKVYRPQASTQQESSTWTLLWENWYRTISVGPQGGNNFLFVYLVFWDRVLLWSPG
jgi:hypothetical protein